ncbi:uncharacterized protein PAC_17716 [Phialocephala subalpina]|uniref:Uncharacterized protein n=1 Tax=Phialocephala subalpina TaxID=576137 RepID=A0A1L7XS97_9HELO|nr:uncharacterized protein PAC_17716 [Phialocephala subalpina]
MHRRTCSKPSNSPLEKQINSSTTNRSYGVDIQTTSSRTRNRGSKCTKNPECAHPPFNTNPGQRAPIALSLTHERPAIRAQSPDHLGRNKLSGAKHLSGRSRDKKPDALLTDFAEARGVPPKQSEAKDPTETAAWVCGHRGGRELEGLLSGERVTIWTVGFTSLLRVVRDS